MRAFFEKRLKVYEHEFSPFIWMALLFFLLFFVTAIFRNYVDTTFLKRYGVEHIPLMMVVNSLLTLLLFDFMNRIGGRFPDHLLLAGFLLFYAGLVSALFFTIRLGAEFPYPLLFQLLYLQDSVLLVYLWNISGDLFDARQGRRIFPLITASQVIGTTSGNLLTSPIATALGRDSTLFVYAGACCLTGYLLITTTRKILPSAGTFRSNKTESQRKRWVEIPGIIKKYPLIRYLIILGLIPNVLLPIFLYQFNVIANRAFISENSLISFLSIFRGGTTFTIFIILMFMGRLYNRVGIVYSTMIQPVNFAVVFAGLSFFFNIVVASYGQFTILLVQRAIAGPINKILFNLVPKEVGEWSRVFVRGTVVKFGIMIGSLLMLCLKPLMSSQALAPIAFFLSMYLFMETLAFGRQYKRALKQVITEERIDFDQLEAASSMNPGSTAMDVHSTKTTHWEEIPTAEPPNATAMPSDAALKLMGDDDEMTRATAAASFAVSRDPRAVSGLIRLLNDREEVRRAAMESLASYGKTIRPFLEETLIESPLRVQRGILEVLRLSGQKDADILPFIGRRVSEAYENLNAIHQLESDCTSGAVDMLKTHLEEKNQELLSLIFHALWVNHADMRLMYEALKSSETSAAVELVETSVDRAVSKYFVPLIDSIPLKDRIHQGRGVLPLKRSRDMESILTHLVASRDATTRMLAAYTVGECYPGLAFLPVLDHMTEDRDRSVREVALYAMKRCLNEVTEMPDIIDRTNKLKDFLMFDGMGMRELQAIASVITLETPEPGEIIIKEGESNASLYLVVKGRLTLYRQYGTSDEVEERSLGPGSFMGELRLFTELPSSVTCVATEAAELYVLRKQHFQEIMKIYPQIGMNLCLFFALKIVALQSRGEL